jgi:hypothetical protein
MSTSTPLPKRPRPLPDPKHRKQTFWQIWVPLCLSILVVLFLAVLAAISAGSTGAGDIVTKWSHLSTIYIISPAMIAGFILLVVFGGVIYGMARLLDILPVYTRMVQGFFRLLAVKMRIWSDKTAQPVLAFKSWWAGFEAALKHIGL